MNLNDHEHRRSLYQSFITIIAFVGQLLCLQRAFPSSPYTFVLGGLMLVSVAWDWQRTRFQKTNQRRQDVQARFESGYLAIVIATAFAVARFGLLIETGNSLIDFAHATVLTMLVVQIAVIIRKGTGRIELLVCATVATTTSLVCAEESVSLYRQIAESAIAICLFALLANAARRSSKTENLSRNWQGTGVSIIVLVIVVMISRPVATAMDSWLPTLQLQLTGAIEDSVIEDYRTPSVVRRYVDTASLNDVVDQHTNDPQAVALRVYSEQTPGYLRGRVFNRYGYGRWIRNRNDLIPSADERTRQAMNVVIVSPDRKTADSIVSLPTKRENTFDMSKVNRFSIRENPSGRPVVLEIENDPRRGEFFFLPLQTTQIHGAGDRLIIDFNGVVQTGLDTRQSYFATVHQFEPPSPVTDPIRDVNLSIPPELQQPVKQLAEQLCSDAMTIRAKARRVSDFFQKNFRYSLERKTLANNVEPLRFFLETRHAAHCEYFASATALLLRAAGIPARYVTGYVVDKKSDDEDYWLGRNVDAHAWVEAYDESSRRWFIVESTPGRTVQGFNFGTDRTSDETKQVGSEADTGPSWLEFDWQLLKLIQAGEWSLAMVELSESLRWPLGAITVVFTILMLRNHRQTLPYDCDRYSSDFQRLLRSADRSMNRLGLARSNRETLHRFAERIESKAEATAIDKDRAQWYREFAELRYKSLPPFTLRSFPK